MRIAVVLLVALIPATAAQVGQTCSVELAGPAQQDFAAALEVGATRDVPITITNGGSTEAAGRLSVGTAPPGWSWDDRERAFTLAPSAQATETFQIRYLGQDERTTSARFEVGLDGTCVVGPFTTQRVVGSYPLDLAGVVPPVPPAEPEPMWPWVLGAVVVVALLALGARDWFANRPARVKARTDEAERTVVAGRGTSFPLVVENAGKKPINAKLQIRGLPQGWNGMLALSELVLNPREKRSLWVMVRAPQGANPGEGAAFSVAVQPDEGPERSVSYRAAVVTEA